MATLRFDSEALASSGVSVRESDIYSGFVYMKLSHENTTGEVRGCNEVFMTPEQLDLLGRFLIRQAEEIHTAQAMRV